MRYSQSAATNSPMYMYVGWVCTHAVSYEGRRRRGPSLTVLGAYKSLGDVFKTSGDYLIR